MPSKKKKYNSRFPPARIKKIMQADEEVGKVAAVVPVIISRTLEIFVESLLKKASQITRSRNARTLTPAHLKASILADSQFAFLKETVQSLPDIQPSAEEDQLTEGHSVTTSTTPPKISRKPRLPAPSATSTGVAQRKRGRPRKSFVNNKIEDKSMDEEDEDDLDDDEEESDEDENDDNSSCDNSNPSSSSTFRPPAAMPMPIMPFPSRSNNIQQQLDEDYDA